MSRHAAPILLVTLLVGLTAVPLLAASEEGAANETLFKWINFFTFFGPAAYFGRKPLKAAFDAIRKEIRSEIDRSQTQKKEAEERIADIEQRLSRLEETTGQLRREAAAETASQFERIHEAARGEGERIAAMARAEIESSRRAAQLALRAHSAQLAVELAEQQLRKQLTEDFHAGLFKAFVGQLERRN